MRTKVLVRRGAPAGLEPAAPALGVSADAASISVTRLLPWRWTAVLSIRGTAGKKFVSIAVPTATYALASTPPAAETTTPVGSVASSVPGQASGAEKRRSHGQ